MAGVSRGTWVRVIAATVLVLGAIVGLYLLYGNESEGKDKAEQKVEEKTSEAEQFKELAIAFRESLRAQCQAGIKSACHQLRGLDGDLQQVVEEIQEAEIQDPEVQEGEVQEPEVQEPEQQDPERQDPDPNDPDPVDDPETQDDEFDDPEQQEPEIQDEETQDPEKDDPEPNDPQDPPATFLFKDLFLGQDWLCTLDPDAPPKDPTFTCTMV